ncbi:hypothetical protein Vretifemale_15959, partial [Volvox reticuliferus]
MRQSAADGAAGGGGGGGQKDANMAADEGRSVRHDGIARNDDDNDAAAAAAASTGPYMLKVLTCRQLNGTLAIRAAFPRQLDAAVASGQPQEVVLLYQKGSDGGGSVHRSSPGV